MGRALRIWELLWKRNTNKQIQDTIKRKRVFFITNFQKIVGKIVSMDLKKNWTLDLRGDHISLINYLTYINRIDFMHYDSDKSYNGRKKTINMITKCFFIF